MVIPEAEMPWRLWNSSMLLHVAVICEIPPWDALIINLINLGY